MSRAIFVLSAAILAHEVCLLRVLAIGYYSHAASLVISVALLAFGAAGTLLALWPRLKRAETVAVCAALYGALAPASVRAAAAVDFNILEVGWNPSQWLGLLAVQAVFVVPFLAAALAIAVALALHAKHVGKLYAMNLLGSGAGAIAAMPLLTLGAPEDVLTGVAAVAAGSAVFVAGRAAKLAAVGGVALALLVGGGALPMSPFKDLPATPSKTILETRHGPMGRVDLVRSPALHHAPGLSLTSSARIPPQDGLFVDGHLVGVREDGPGAYLEDTVGTLPFLFVAQPRVLLLGVGPDLPRATDVVEANADLLELSGAAGPVATPRAHLDQLSRYGSDAPYDVILLHVGALDPVHETPLVTIEGLALALRCARSGVAVSTPLTTPPRPGLKLLATAEQVTPHVVAARSVDRLCVLLRHTAPSVEQMERVLAFCRRNGFDMVRPVEARPERPRHERAIPLLPPGADYPYDVRPATDARPYFHKYFRWSRIGDVFDPSVISFVEWPFVALLMAFLQVVVLSLLLLLVPLLVSRAARTPAPLFLALGLAFMLVEMGFLARATVLLGGPAVAASAVLGGFLVGSGLGSWMGERLGSPLRRAALGVALLALPAYLLLGSSIGAIALLSAAVAFPMGMPFPAALGRLAAPSVPWALAVNGCASVAASAAAPLIGSSFGILAVVGGGALLYALVALLGAPLPAGSARG